MSGSSRTLGLKDFMEALADAGLPSSRWWVSVQIRRGNIVLPRQAHAPKRYNLTFETISKAVDAIKTEGKYHY